MRAIERIVNFHHLVEKMELRTKSSHGGLSQAPLKPFTGPPSGSTAHYNTGFLSRTSNTSLGGNPSSVLEATKRKKLFQPWLEVCSSLQTPPNPC